MGPAVEDSTLPYTVDVVDLHAVSHDFKKIVEEQRVALPSVRASERVGGAWREVALGDLIDIKHGYAFKGAFIHDESVGDVLLTPGNFAIGGGFQAGKTKHYNGTVPSEFVLSENDLLVTMTDLSKQADTLGYPALIPASPNGLRFLHNQRLGKVVLRDSESTHKRYIYYVLCSKEYRDEVLASATGTTVKHTSPERIKRYRFPLPPLPEQRTIAHILGTLDDKIELNRRTNETLEAMARALFKSWFVDFEPVRAKMEGRWRPGESLPGLPADLYDLFPDRLVDSELGEIPEGWAVKALGECLATLETGKRPAGGVSGIESGMPSVGAESIERVGAFEFGKTKFVPWEFYDSMKRGIVQDGDVLIYKDGGRPGELSPAVTYTSHGFPFSECCINEHVFRVRSSLFSQQLLYCYLTTPYAFWQMREFATGVAQPGLNQRAVEAIAITMPGDRRVLRVCEEVIGPLIDGCNANALVSRDLSQIRDVLLPKLASGEIRII